MSMSARPLPGPYFCDQRGERKHERHEGRFLVAAAGQRSGPGESDETHGVDRTRPFFISCSPDRQDSGQVHENNRCDS